MVALEDVSEEQRDMRDHSQGDNPIEYVPKSAELRKTEKEETDRDLGCCKREHSLIDVQSRIPNCLERPLTCAQSR